MTNFLTRVAGVFVVISVLAYALGWAYLTGFVGAFQINPVRVTLNINDVYILNTSIALILVGNYELFLQEIIILSIIFILVLYIQKIYNFLFTLCNNVVKNKTGRALKFDPVVSRSRSSIFLAVRIILSIILFYEIMMFSRGIGVEAAIEFVENPPPAVEVVLTPSARQGLQDYKVFNKSALELIEQAGSDGTLRILWKDRSVYIFVILDKRVHQVNSFPFLQILTIKSEAIVGITELNSFSAL